MKKNKVSTLMSEANPTLTENRYVALKKDESRGPKQKVHDGIKNIKHALNEIETNLHFLSKYKTEIGLPSDNYYKRTKANLAKISEKINVINTKLKSMY